MVWIGNRKVRGATQSQKRKESTMRSDKRHKRFHEPPTISLGFFVDSLTAFCNERTIDSTQVTSSNEPSNEPSRTSVGRIKSIGALLKEKFTMKKTKWHTIPLRYPRIRRFRETMCSKVKEDQELATCPVDVDSEGALLHAVIEFIRDEKIPYDDGLDIIHMLYTIDPKIIHYVDENMNTPIELVHIALIETANNDRIEKQLKLRRLERLEEMIFHLRKLAIILYRREKGRCETDGFRRKEASGCNHCHFEDEISMLPLCGDSLSNGSSASTKSSIDFSESSSFH